MAGFLERFHSGHQECRQCDELSVSFLEKNGLLRVCANGFPEASAALEVLLLLVLGEAEFGVEHVVGAYEMAERRG